MYIFLVPQSFTIQTRPAAVGTTRICATCMRSPQDPARPKMVIFPGQTWPARAFLTRTGTICTGGHSKDPSVMKRSYYSTTSRRAWSAHPAQDSVKLKQCYVSTSRKSHWPDRFLFPLFAFCRNNITVFNNCRESRTKRPSVHSAVPVPELR